ncbi:hypothetical protein TEA_012304 [Camellia sinensis var. sinensis]|uniref:Uncharacterized protein n=1 Tax=Camellia sinensis var. sinensis TaxID=542762 RepID=A0A4S4D4D6_CAMSN|nr:hypothetical protein TEA_012304 [Camellia sinensis var. sinensis]
MGKNPVKYCVVDTFTVSPFKGAPTELPVPICGSETLCSLTISSKNSNPNRFVLFGRNGIWFSDLGVAELAKSETNRIEKVLQCSVFFTTFLWSINGKFKEESDIGEVETGGAVILLRRCKSEPARRGEKLKICEAKQRSQIERRVSGENGAEIIARLKRDLLPTMLSGVMYWPICDFVTFKFIPVHLQPLVSNSFSYLWTIYMTYMASLDKASSTT